MEENVTPMQQEKTLFGQTKKQLFGEIFRFLLVGGIATIVDSLIAIKKAVFEENRISLDAFTALLKNNWQGNESLRKYIRDTYPKYGNNDPEADTLAADLVAFMAQCINNKPNARGGVYRMGNYSQSYDQRRLCARSRNKLPRYGKRYGSGA